MALEIINITKSPISILVRSKKGTKRMTNINIPGIGSDKNKVIIEDEDKTEFLERLINKKLIKINNVPSKYILNRGK